MEFKVNQNLLLQALRHTRTIITKGPLDVYHNFVLSFPDDPNEASMTVHTSNGFVWLSETVLLEEPAVDARPIAVWHIDLYRAIKSLDDEPLHFIVGDMQMTVKHSCGSFHLPLSSQANEFLQIPRPCPDTDATDGYSFEYEVPVLASILRRCNFAMAQDELRPVMNGVYMNLTEDYADYVSSEGHILVRVRKDSVRCASGTAVVSIILPAQVAKTLLRILPSTGDVLFEYQKELVKKETRIDACGLRQSFDKQVRRPMARITINDTITMSFCPVDGKYPKYWGVIPDSSVFQTTIDRKKLIKSLDRLSLFSATSGLVKMEISDTELHMNSRDVDYDLAGEEILPCTSVKTDGSELIPGYSFLTVGIRDKSLSKILKALSSENVALRFIDSNKAFTIHPVPQPDTEDITMLLMPMLYD